MSSIIAVRITDLGNEITELREKLRNDHVAGKRINMEIMKEINELMRIRGYWRKVRDQRLLNMP